MNIAIVEDEPAHSRLLQQYIERWGRSYAEHVRVFCYESAEQFLCVSGTRMQTKKRAGLLYDPFVGRTVFMWAAFNYRYPHPYSRRFV